jgi:hypothetical protein
MDSSFPFTSFLSVGVALAVGLGYLVNLVARKPSVNPWRVGLVALSILGLGHVWLVNRLGLLNVADPGQQGERFGYYAIGPIAVPLLVVLWRDRRFSRREFGPEAAKGSFVHALIMCGAFVVVMGLGFALFGRFLIGSSRSAALAKLAQEVNATLPKVVDADTELFNVSADGDALVYDYRLANTLKADIDPNAVAAFRSGIVARACDTPHTRDAFLKKGIVLRHMYYDKNRELITSVQVALKDCGGPS